jgi:hypothetical protein
MRSRMGAVPAAARSEGLLIEQVGDETVVYDLESKEAHCLSALAARVFELCDGRLKLDGIAEAAGIELGRSVTTDEVVAAVEQLEERRLLDTPFLVMHEGGISRRDAIRRGVFATALVTTIGVPVATAAATDQIPTGCTGCGKNPDCISGHCCQSNPGKACNQSCCVGANNSCHVSNCVVPGTNTPCDPKTSTVTCLCDCTVLISDADCAGGACPCGTCPAGSVPCCTAG